MTDAERPSPPASERTLPIEIPLANGGLAGRHVTLCVTGSIAAYKAVLLVRELMASGAIVDVILSPYNIKFLRVREPRETRKACSRRPSLKPIRFCLPEESKSSTRK
jgi:hypothetical protein